MDREGGDVKTVAPAASGPNCVQRQQPTWSPHADRIAWTEYAGMESYLVTTTHGISECERPKFEEGDTLDEEDLAVSTPFPPFYYYWHVRNVWNVD